MVTKNRFLAVLVPFSVLFANVVNFSTQLLVPRYLPAAQYSAFATLWATGQLVAVVVFEWMRFGVVRFSEGTDRDLNERRKRALFVSYGVACVFLFFVAAISSFFFEGDLRWAIAVVALYALSQGVFDGRQALARAQFRNFSFALGWISRSVLTLALCIASASWFQTGVAVLVALSLAYIAVSVFFLKEIDFTVLFKERVEYRDLRFLARYGAFVAVSSSLSAALPTFVRALLVEFGDKAEVAGAILALDLSQKALVVVGMLVNVMVLQRSIKIIESGDLNEKAAQMKLHVVISTAVLMPFGVLFYALQPILIEFLVPQEYKVSYLASAGFATTCAMLLCLRQFSIDSLFVVVGESTRSVISPIVAIAFTLVGAYFFNFVGIDPSLTVLWAMLIGLAASVLVSVYFVGVVSGIEWPAREVALLVLGGGGMFFLVKWGEGFSSHPLWVLVLCFLVLALYLFFLLVLNVGGVRHRFRSLFLR